MDRNAISPSHYKNEGWEAIEVIEAVVSNLIRSGTAPEVAYNVGSSLKYLLRSGRKGDVAEQLGKAEWHIRRAVNMCQKPKEDTGFIGQMDE